MNHPPSTATHATGTIHFQFLRKNAATLSFPAGLASPAAACCAAASCFFLKIMLAVSSCIFQSTSALCRAPCNFCPFCLFPFCTVQKGDIDSLSHFRPIHKRLNFVLMVPRQTFMELSHPFSSCILYKAKEAAPRSPEALPLFEHDLYSAVSSTTTYTPAGTQAAHAPSLSSQPNCSHTWSGH